MAQEEEPVHERGSLNREKPVRNQGLIKALESPLIKQNDLLSQRFNMFPLKSGMRQKMIHRDQKPL